MAAERGQRQRILLRITPGVEAHTHHYIQTGQLDSKFGFGLAEGHAVEAIRRALEAPHLQLVGLHAHIGSQIFELEGFRRAIAILVDLIKETHDRYGFECRYLNVGGGLGIRYTDEDTPITIDEYVAGQDRRRARGDGAGGPSGATSPGGARPVDRCEGGADRLPSGHHQGGAGYPHVCERRRWHERQHAAHALRRGLRGDDRRIGPTRPSDTVVTVAGKHCESSDILIKDATIARPRGGRYPGDAGDRSLLLLHGFELQRQSPARPCCW